MKTVVTELAESVTGLLTILIPLPTYSILRYFLFFARIYHRIIFQKFYQVPDVRSIKLYDAHEIQVMSYVSYYFDFH